VTNNEPMFLFQFYSIYINLLYYQQYNFILNSICSINILKPRFQNSNPNFSKHTLQHVNHAPKYLLSLHINSLTLNIVKLKQVFISLSYLLYLATMQAKYITIVFFFQFFFRKSLLSLISCQFNHKNMHSNSKQTWKHQWI
jgi:hypothetical protein